HCPQARATTVAETPESRRLAENTKLQSNIKYHEDFEKQKGKLTQIADDAETLRIRNTSKIISNATYHGEYEKKKQMEERRTLIGGEENAYPSNEIHMNSIAGSQHQSSAYPPCQSDRTMTQTKLSQSITTNNSGPIYDPNSINQQIRQISASSQHHHQMRPNLGLCFRAIYDYNAQDVDEVTFVDGDLIIHCEPIDDGWMTGTVERTGQTGMLPSNYVEPV
ncbi:Nebulin and SH3 domain containing protein, partial [Sarcoptes scabiei]